MELKRKVYVHPDAGPTLMQLIPFEVPIEASSLRLTTNFNKSIDTGYFETAPIHEESHLAQALKEGSHVFFEGDDISYLVIDKVKKILVNKLGNEKKYKFQVQLIDKVIVLHKISLPNRSLTQPIVGELKETMDIISNYLELYFHEYDGKEILIHNDLYFFDLPKYVEEFKWIQPTLYEVLDDIIGKNYKLKVLSVIGDDRYIFTIEAIRGFKREINHDVITNVEMNNSMDNSPKELSSIVENASGFLMDERYLPQVTDIGVIQEDDENTKWETSFKNNKIIKARIEGFLESFGSTGLFSVVGHSDGYIEFDITDYIQVKDVWDTLPMNKVGFFDALHKDINQTKQGNLWYEVGGKSIGGLMKPVDVNFSFAMTEKYTLTMILNHIWKYNRDKIESAIIWPVNEKPDPMDFENFWKPLTQQQINKVVFHNVDASALTLNIEYEVVDNFRYDTSKKRGYGTTIKNQNEGFVNFDKFVEHQNDLVKKLGSDEYIIMGNVKDVLDLPEKGQTYLTDNIIVQITTIEKYNSLDFMAIATSKHNRVDDDMVINNRRRYFQIVSEQDSIERFEFFETMVEDEEELNEISSYNMALLKSYNKRNQLVAQGLVKVLYKNLGNEKIFYGKTLDNKFLGKEIRYDKYKKKDIKILDGVFYADENTGEFHRMEIRLGFGNEDYEDGFPNNVGDFTSHTEPFNVYYKDVGERISFGIRYHIDVYEDVDDIPDIQLLPDFTINLEQGYGIFDNGRVWEGYGFDIELDQAYEVDTDGIEWNAYSFDILLNQKYEIHDISHDWNSYGFDINLDQHYDTHVADNIQTSYMFDILLEQNYGIVDNHAIQRSYLFDVLLNQNYQLDAEEYIETAYMFDIRLEQNYNILEQSFREMSYEYDILLDQSYEIEGNEDTEVSYLVIFVRDWNDTVIKEQWVNSGENATFPTNQQISYGSGYEANGYTGSYTNVTSDRIIRIKRKVEVQKDYHWVKYTEVVNNLPNPSGGRAPIAGSNCSTLGQRHNTGLGFPDIETGKHAHVYYVCELK